MPKKELLDQLDELLNIPQAERVILHKVKELKLFFKEEIERYRHLKEGFIRAAYGQMKFLDGEENQPGEQVYQFELNQDQYGEWVPGNINPPPPPGYDAYDIIPGEIIEYIDPFRINPDKIETHNKIVIESLNGRTFNLSFIKYTDHHVLGTIAMDRLPVKGTGSEPAPDQAGNIFYKNNHGTHRWTYRDEKAQ